MSNSKRFQISKWLFVSNVYNKYFFKYNNTSNTNTHKQKVKRLNDLNLLNKAPSICCVHSFHELLNKWGFRGERSETCIADTLRVKRTFTQSTYTIYIHNLHAQSWVASNNRCSTDAFLAQSCEKHWIWLTHSITRGSSTFMHQYSSISDAIRSRCNFYAL